MSTTALAHELQAFAVELFERSGGVAEWPEQADAGSVVMPGAVAAAAQLPGAEFALTSSAAPGALQVGLAGEFLDVAARVLEATVPRDGAFCIPDRYLTSRDLSEKITRTFGWQNARATYGAAEPTMVEYQLWTLQGSLRSEDVWEGVFSFAINAESQAIVPLPDVFHEPDLRGDAPAGTLAGPGTYATAIAEARRRLIESSAEFTHRLEQRLVRDRKRLEEYYRALTREADGSKRRTTVALSQEEVAAKKRAVSLELRRKLAELEETYALQAVVRPVALARVRQPALAVPIEIQRKQARRSYRLYWNSLLKALEPLACSRCRRATYSATFTNDTVDLLCASCAEAG